MIPLNFYRDDNYVYYNNPNGITKKMTIAQFEAIMSGESELPAYTSSNNGEVLSVDSDGDLDWVSLPPAELPAYSSANSGEVLSVDSDGDLEWTSLSPSGGLTTKLLGVQYSGETITVAAGGSESLMSFAFVDGETYDPVNMAQTDFDLCAIISLQVPGGLIISSVALPDNNAYTSLTIVVSNITSNGVQLSQNYDIGYLKLLNPRAISAPSEP